MGNQATPEDPPTSALPHSPPEWSLGGMTGRNCSRASPSQPQEPTSSSTLLISFCPPGKGAKKPGTWDPGQCLSTQVLRNVLGRNRSPADTFPPHRTTRLRSPVSSPTARTFTPWHDSPYTSVWNLPQITRSSVLCPKFNFEPAS